MTQTSSLSLLVIALVVTASIQAAPQSKTVQVTLRKDTAMQGGQFDQPMTSYYVKTEFGTPGKPFNMLADINAREVWVPHYSKLGMVYFRLNYKDGYCKKDSSTSLKETIEVYKIDYNGCELSGKAYTDVMGIKDVIESPQPVRFGQRFLSMSSASNDNFSKYKSVDGVLALGPWPISETGSDLPIVAMNRANLTSGLIFGLQLIPDSEDDIGGELTIGDAVVHKYDAKQAKYHHLVSQHSWELGLQRVILGANSMDACPGPRPCTAVLSTTTNDIHGPPETVRVLLKLLEIDIEGKDLKKSKTYEIDCLKVATAPTLTFIIDGAYYELPPTSYIKRMQTGLILKSNTCYVSLLPNLSSDKWELGTNFLSNFRTVFDMKSQSVAFTPLK